MSESLTLDVGGMTCEGCSNRVKSALESIQGVNSADVSHESGIAIICTSKCIERNHDF